MNSPVVVGQRYALIERLDGGGFGEVWKAADQRLGGKRVAVKRILLTDSSPATRERDIALFRREALSASRLRHPNVVGVTDFFVEDGAPFIVMEYVEGQTLTRSLPSTGFGVAQAARLGAQIAAALAATHAIGLVHRDVKPDNVIVEASGSLVLVDFGIARGTEDSRLTSTGFIRGTMCYTAPEVFDGATPSAPCDIWSLGATLYELVQGHRAFDGPTKSAILRAILVDDIPVAINGGPLADLIGEMLDRTPARRPSAEEARQSLERIVARVEASEAPTTVSPTPDPVVVAPTEIAPKPAVPDEPTLVVPAPTDVASHPAAPDEPTLVVPAPTDVAPDSREPAAPATSRRTRMPRWRILAGVGVVVLTTAGTIAVVAATSGGDDHPTASGSSSSPGLPSTGGPSPSHGPSTTAVSWSGQPAFWWYTETNADGDTVQVTLQLGPPIGFKPGLSIGDTVAGNACEVHEEDLLVPAEITATNTSDTSLDAAADIEVDGADVENHFDSGTTCRDESDGMRVIWRSLAPGATESSDFFFVVHGAIAASSTALDDAQGRFDSTLGDEHFVPGEISGPVDTPDVGTFSLGLARDARPLRAEDVDCTLAATSSPGGDGRADRDDGELQQCNSALMQR